MCRKYSIKIEERRLFQGPLKAEAELPIPADWCQNMCHLCPGGQLGSMSTCAVSATHRALLLAHGKLAT